MQLFFSYFFCFVFPPNINEFETRFVNNETLINNSMSNVFSSDYLDFKISHENRFLEIKDSNASLAKIIKH